MKVCAHMHACVCVHFGIFKICIIICFIEKSRPNCIPDLGADHKEAGGGSLASLNFVLPLHCGY